MATLNPYEPETAVRDTSDPNVYGNVATFMGDPRVQASLLSFGLQALQPPEFGQNGLAHIASAIGAGGESAQLQNKQRLAQEEAASKQDLRGAQADAAQARAATAGAQSDAAAQRAATAQAQLEAANTRNRLNNQVKLSNLYQTYVRDLSKQNLTAPANQQTPVLSIQEWIQQNPMVRALLPDSGGSGMGDTTSDVSGTPTSSAKPVATQRDIDALRAHPELKDRYLARFGVLPPGFQ